MSMKHLVYLDTLLNAVQHCASAVGHWTCAPGSVQSHRLEAHTCPTLSSRTCICESQAFLCVAA